jgi:hypothetical protein
MVNEAACCRTPFKVSFMKDGSAGWPRPEPRAARPNLDPVGAIRGHRAHSVVVRVAVHQPAPDSTQATCLDSAPDLSSANSTQDHCGR